MHHTVFLAPTTLNIIDLVDFIATYGYMINIERGWGSHGIFNAFYLYILHPNHEPIKWTLPIHSAKPFGVPLLPKIGLSMEKFLKGRVVRE